MVISQTKVSPEWMTLSNLALSHLSPWLFSITWKQRCLTGCRQPYHLSPESFIVWSKKRKKSLLEAAKEAQEGRPEIWCLGWGGADGAGAEAPAAPDKPTRSAGCLAPSYTPQPSKSPVVQFTAELGAEGSCPRSPQANLGIQ